MKPPQAEPEQFRKDGETVKAVQILDSLPYLYSVHEWVASNGGTTFDPFLPHVDRMISLQTVEGDVWAGLGDWIVQDAKGTFSVHKEGIFTDEYEAIR